jgi:hypothetical protein
VLTDTTRCRRERRGLHHQLLPVRGHDLGSGGTCSETARARARGRRPDPRR